MVSAVAKSNPQRAPGQPGRLPGVEIFAAGKLLAGNHPTPEEWTEDDLACMARNFALLASGPRPLLIPKCKIGHDQDQQILQRTDLPAAGWVDAVGKQGHRLFADLGKVPPIVADWIDQGLYSTVSIEADRQPDPNLLESARSRGIQLKGPVLKAVAFLGAQPPAVKDILHLPPTQADTRSFSQRSAGPRRRPFCVATNPADSGRRQHLPVF